MTDYKMASATIAFDQTVWPNCGVVLREQTLIFNRDGELELQEWPIHDRQQYGPRMYCARRTEDDKLISIIASGGCGCR